MVDDTYSERHSDGDLMMVVHAAKRPDGGKGSGSVTHVDIDEH